MSFVVARCSTTFVQLRISSSRAGDSVLSRALVFPVPSSHGRSPANRDTLPSDPNRTERSVYHGDSNVGPADAGLAADPKGTETTRPRPGKSGTGVDLVSDLSANSHEFVRDPESHLEEDRNHGATFARDEPPFSLFSM